MKLLLYSLFFLVTVFNGGFGVVSRINEYTKRAATAYAHGDYTEAIVAYRYLVEDLEVQDDQLQLNLAHAYYRAGQWAQAQEAYRPLTNHASFHLRAVAHLQLGNIATQQKKYRQALGLYKTALIAQPGNDAARYNYELLKKYLALHPEAAKENTPDQAPPQEANNAGPDSLSTPPPAADVQEPQPKVEPDASGDREEEVNRPEPAPNGQSQQAGGNGRQNPAGTQEREQQSGRQEGDTEGINPDGQPEATEQPRSTSTETASGDDVRAQTRRARLQQMNMSPEKARLLLDAMRSAELQYIQQLPKKSDKKPDRSKPDW